MGSPVEQHVHQDAAVVVTACQHGHVHLLANGPSASINMPMSPDQAIELAAMLVDAADAARALGRPIGFASH